MNWFTAFAKRLFMATPDFFKKIIYFGIALGSIGGGILLAGNQLPAWLVDWADNLVQIGIVSSIVAGVAVKKPEALK